MTAQDIRNQYLKFFEERGHKVIPRALGAAERPDHAIYRQRHAATGALSAR